MANHYFRFKQFTVHQERCAMKVTTDGCLFGAWCAEEIRREGRASTLLDIGTGSGLLTLMVAQKYELEVDAVELDKEAAEQARENMEAAPWKKMFRVYSKDILQFPRERKYDVIISNPPFYENELASPIPGRNTAHHSRGLRLAQVLEEIRLRLQEKGRFFLLLPYKRINEVEKLLRDTGLHTGKKVLVRQSVNHAPFRVMLLGVQEAIIEQKVSEISIRGEDGTYTPAFKELLRDYYLYL